jgi:hypothetical protein
LIRDKAAGDTISVLSAESLEEEDEEEDWQ